MKHKALAYTFIVVVFAATVSLLYYMEVRNAIPPYGELSAGRTADYIERKYANTEYDFEIKYPKSYELQLASDPSAQQISSFVKGGIPLAGILIPQSAFENTNFNRAWINMAVRENATQGQCQTYRGQTDELELMEDKVNIGKNTFFTTKFTGAAAGTRYDTALYRIRHNETCYELELTAAISNLGNFDPAGKVEEVNEDEVWNRLNDVVRTFKFIE